VNKAKILVVEDEFIAARNIKNHLEGAGYQVSGLVPSGEEAIAHAETERPDLILMDIALNGKIDGIEAAWRIRSKLDVPVVYVTALDNDELVARAKETEPFGYIIKPFAGKNLEVSIEMALHRHLSEKRLREAETRYRGIFEYCSSGFYLLEPLDEGGDFLIREMNRSAELLDRVKKEEVLSRSFRAAFPGAEKCGLLDYIQKAYRTGRSEYVPGLFYQDDRISGWRACCVYRLPSNQVVELFQDVTEYKQSELEKERMIEELNETVNKFSRLNGLLRICASCKKILDENGRWRQIEAYIQDRSQAKFTHTICPECTRRLYPDLFKE